jgi:stage II sporulation protein GA (sporulation sigma-E factor processing peptidase)
MQVIYADTLFLINFIIDYLLLLATAKICSVVTRRLRLAAAAALGGLYSVLVVIPATEFLANPFVKVAAGIAIALIAFIGQARIIRTTLVFFAVEAALGGAVMAVSLIGGEGLIGGMLTPVNLRLLTISFAVCYVIITLVFRRTAGNKGGIVTLKLRSGDREVNIRALKDTGNSLTDPMTGRQVIVAGVTEVKTLFPNKIRDTVSDLHRKDAVKVLEELGSGDKTMRFQLIPYSAVGVSGGMLLAFRPDEVVVDGRDRTGMLLALSPNSVSDNGTYGALLGA